jgi:hypothetical protein
VKHDELVRTVRRAAREADKDWGLVRKGGEHEIWACGRTRVQVPRHREVNERTAIEILRDLEPELGKDWWR